MKLRRVYHEYLDPVNRAAITAAKQNSSLVAAGIVRDLGFIVSDIRSLVRGRNVNYVDSRPYGAPGRAVKVAAIALNSVDVVSAAAVLVVRGHGVDYTIEADRPVTHHVAICSTGVARLAMIGWQLGRGRHGSHHYSRTGRLNLVLEALPLSYVTFTSGRALYRRRGEWQPQLAVATRAIGSDLKPPRDVGDERHALAPMS